MPSGGNCRPLRGSRIVGLILTVIEFGVCSEAVYRQGCLTGFPGRGAHEHAKETHNLRVIVSGMLVGQTRKSVDTAETNW